MKMDAIWTTVHNERAALANDLHSLDISQWDTPSLCDAWTVHDVLAHLIDDARTTRLSFVARLVLAGLNFDRVNQKGVAKERRGAPQETLESFRQVSGRATSAPAPLASRLGEIIVHGEDIRRPLGISHIYPIEAVIGAIEYQLATSDSMGGSKNRADGLHLVASDAQWSHGTGAKVTGNAIDILMSLTGRPCPPESLTGEGASRLLK